MERYPCVSRRDRELDARMDRGNAGLPWNVYDVSSCESKLVGNKEESRKFKT